MDVAKAFGAVLKRARLEAGLTQEELAARSGYSREHVTRLELGTKRPTLSTIFDLSETLGVSAAEIVRRVEKRL